jgi:C1A family cysteine protease
MVNASKWSGYDSGVFKGCDAANINHAVVAVGYQKNNHFKILNSWGADWGEDGFMKLPYGNSCNIC